MAASEWDVVAEEPDVPRQSAPWARLPAAQPYLARIAEVERKYGLPADMLGALLQRESNFQTDAVSSAGAQGIAQIMASQHPDVDPSDPMASIDYAGQYLRENYDQFGSWDRALAAYNYGPGNLADVVNAHRDWRSRLPAETSAYVKALSPIQEITPTAQPMVPGGDPWAVVSEEPARISAPRPEYEQPSFWEAVGEQLQPASLGDIATSVKGMLGRTVQGMELQRLEETRDLMIGKHPNPIYPREPEWFGDVTAAQRRANAANPEFIALLEKIEAEKGVGREISQEQQDIAARNQSALAKMSIGAAQSIAAAAPSLAITMATRNPALGTAAIYPQEFAREYGEGAEQGLSREQNLAHAGVGAGFETVTEFMPVKYALAPGTPLLMRMAKEIASEIPGETVAHVAQTINDHVAALPDITLKDFLDPAMKSLEGLPDVYASVILGGGAQAALGHGLVKAQEALTPLPDIDDASIRDAADFYSAMRGGAPTTSPLSERELAAEQVQREAAMNAGQLARTGDERARNDALTELLFEQHRDEYQRRAAAAEQEAQARAGAEAEVRGEAADDARIRAETERQNALMADPFGRGEGKPSKETRKPRPVATMPPPATTGSPPPGPERRLVAPVAASAQGPAYPGPIDVDTSAHVQPGESVNAPNQRNLNQLRVDLIHTTPEQRERWASSIQATLDEKGAVKGMEVPQDMREFLSASAARSTMYQLQRNPQYVIDTLRQKETLEQVHAAGAATPLPPKVRRPRKQPTAAGAAPTVPTPPPAPPAGPVSTGAAPAGGSADYTHGWEDAQSGQRITREGAKRLLAGGEPERQYVHGYAAARGLKPAANASTNDVLNQIITAAAGPAPATTPPPRADVQRQHKQLSEPELAQLHAEIKPLLEPDDSSDPIVDAALVGRALQIDRAATTRAAVEHRDNAADFMAAIIRRIIAPHDEAANQVTAPAGGGPQVQRSEGTAEAAQEGAAAAEPAAAEPAEAEAVTPAEEDEVTGLDEDIGEQAAGGLREQAPAHTGPAPTGTAPQPTSTAPTDPIRAIAAKKKAKIEAAEERKTTPEVAPKRDTELGRSNFDTMWRDLLSMPEVGPQTQSKDEAVRRIQNAPMKEQLRVATRRLRQYFGFKGITIDPKLTSREAMDVLLDAYNNLHTMANVMGLPRQSMGFNGKLTLNLVKSLGNRGTRGMFSWNFEKGFDASVLSLARRADSFTHEWMHALDLNLLMRYAKTRAMGVTGLADYTRNPLKELPADIAKPFTDLLRAIYLVDEESANRMGALTLQAAQLKEALDKAKDKLARTQGLVQAETEREQRATKHEAEGREAVAAKMRARTKRAQDEIAAQQAEVQRLQKELDQANADMKELLEKKSSAFHQGSRYVDRLTGGNYFAIPAELFARAGESWMGNRIGQQAGTEFLSGSPTFYNENSDRLMQLVYPNADEREGIFQKYDDLFAALTNHEYFEGETVASRIPSSTAFDNELAQAALADPQEMGVFRRMYEASKQDFVNIARTIRDAFNPKSYRGAKQHAKDFEGAVFQSNLVRAFRSTEGMLNGLIRKYKDNPRLVALLRKFMYKVATDPGTRQEQTATAQERIDRRMRADQKHIDRIRATYKLDPTDQKQMDQLFEELARPTEQVRLELEEHNEFLREHLKTIEKDKNKEQEAIRTRAHIAANERVLKMTPLPEKPSTDIQKAALALRKLQDRWYYDAQEAGINLGYVSNYLRRTLNHDAVSEDREGFLDKATLAYQATNELNLRRLQRQLQGVKDETTKYEAVQKRTGTTPIQLKQLQKQRQSIEREMAEIGRLDPAEQAQDYLFSLEMPDIFVPSERATPSAKFTKHRVLAPAADLLLADYYDRNPLQSMYSSAASSAYRTVYADLFGADNEKLKAERLGLVAAGMEPQDLEFIDDAVRVAFGQTGSFHGAADAVANWAMLLAQMKLLTRSAFTNFMEPAITAFRTGDVRDSFKALAFTYIPILRGANRDQLRFVMETLGLVASTAHETVFVNRSGPGTENPLLRAAYVGFGKLSGLTWLTESGRIGAFKVLSSYVQYLSHQLQDGKPQQKREAHDELNEMGVPAAKHAEFAEFMRKLPKGMISAQMMMQSDNHEMKELYGAVMHRLIRQSIQEPQRTERARGSMHPVGRFVFSITNFTRSFERNVILRNVKLIHTAQGYNRKAAYAARFALLVGTTTMLTMLANMARSYWDDPDREKQKDDHFFTWENLLNALDRAGFTGRLSPFFNLYTKYKMDREVSALAAGAVPSHYLDAFARMVAGFRPDATPGQERRAWAALYDLVVGMGAPLVASKKNITGPLGWLGLTKLTSRGWRDAFAEYMVPKTEKELERELSERERREDERLGLKQEKEE